MRIFALETNRETLLKGILSPGEKVLLSSNFHIFKFLPGILWFILITAAAITLYVFIPFLLLPAFTAWIILGVWIIFGAWPFLNLLIDWWHDAIIVTTEEVILINQHTIFRRHIRQMNLDNIASVGDQTQWGNIFGFGKVRFDLKEGVGEHLAVPYIPNAHKVSSTISDAIVEFFRRQGDQQ